MPTPQDIVKLIDFSTGLKPLPDYHLERDDQITLIKQRFESGADLIELVAPEGYGKTVLLSEFCHSNADSTISLFLTGTAKYTFTSNYIRTELANQLHWLVNGKGDNDDNIPDDTKITTLFHKAQISLKRRKSICYIIIDGLYEGEGSTAAIESELSSLLPIGINEFRIIVTKHEIDELKELTSHNNKQTVTLPTLSKRITEQLLEDIIKDPKIRTDVAAICGGILGKIAQIKRIIGSSDTNEIYEKLSNGEIDELFELEWKRTKSLSESQLELVALITKYSTFNSIRQIRQITKLSEDSILSVARSLPFLEIYDEHERTKIRFQSDTFRKFSEKKLGERNELIRDKIITELSQSLDTAESITNLPLLLQDANRHDEILNYVTTENALALINKTNSIYPIKQFLNYGISAALATNNTPSLFGLTTLRSLINGIELVDIVKEELKSSLAIGNTEDAIKIANSANLNEDKLLLYAILALHFKKKDAGSAQSESYIEKTQSLYKLIRPELIDEEKAIEISVELFPIAPDLAIDLIQKCSPTQEKKVNDDQWRMMRLSFGAITSDTSESPGNIHKELQKKLSHEKYDRVLQTTGVIASADNGKDFIKSIESYKGEQFALLRSWCRSFSKRSESEYVIEHAINHALKSTNFNPTASFYIDITRPLEDIYDKKFLEKIVCIIDAQEEIIKKKGSTPSLTELQMTLAAAESKYDTEACTTRLIDTLLDIGNGNYALDVECESLAIFLSKIKKIHLFDDIEKKEGLFEISISRLYDATAELLSKTALHDQIIYNLLLQLSTNLPEIALKICELQNTRERIDSSKIIVLNHHFENSDDINFKIIIDTIKGNSDQSFSRRFLHASAENFQRVSSDIKSIHDITKWQEIIKSTKNRSTESLILSKLYSASHSFISENTVYREDLRTKILSSWRMVGPMWLKFQVGFDIAHMISNFDNELSSSILKEIASERTTGKQEGRASTDTVHMALSICIRGSEIFEKDELHIYAEKLCTLINTTPDSGHRSILFSELCLTLSLNNSFELSKKIWRDHLRPNLLDVKERCADSYTEVLKYSASAIWYIHKDICLDYVKELNADDADETISKIITVGRTKVATRLPYNDSFKNALPLNYEEIYDLITLINELHSDSAIFSNISRTSRSIEASRKSQKITREQQAELERRLTEIAELKLPTALGIQHTGYLISSKAHIFEILSTGSRDWEGLINKANSIANISDRVFVFLDIIDSMPQKKSTRSKQILHETFTLLDQIPSAIDKLQRLERFSEVAWPLDKSIAKSALSKALKIGDNSHDTDIEANQRRLLDVAYKIDKNLPDHLVKEFDNDPARRKFKSNVDNENKFQKFRGLLDRPSSTEPLELSALGLQVPSASWRYLADLTADKVKPVTPYIANQLLNNSTSLEFYNSYPTYALIAESVIRDRKSNNEETKKFFYNLVNSVGFYINLSKSTYRKTFTTQQDSIRSTVIEAGNRDEAIKVIQDWASNCTANRVIIIDPYFCLEDLELLKKISSANTNIEIDVITSLKIQNEKKVPSPLSEAYCDFWINSIASELPYNVAITAIGFDDDLEPPFHDRWYISEDSGLSVGTSFNSLGSDKTSCIKEMGKEELESIIELADTFLGRRQRVYNRRRLKYESFTM